MFRPLLGQPKALQENRSKSCLCFTALWDPSCLQLSRYRIVKYISLYILNLLCNGFSLKSWKLSDMVVY